MQLALIVVGGACLLAAALVGLSRVRRRAVAPVAVAVIGLLLVVLGIVTWPRHHVRPVAVRSTPAATTAVDDPSCVEFTPGVFSNSAPFDENAGLPSRAPGDVQRLPRQVSPGSPAGGVLVRAAAYPSENPGFDPAVAAAIAPVMTDLDTADFDDTSRSGDGGMPFLQLAVGTPRAGTCWVQLASTALVSYRGGADYSARAVPAGARMAAYHATLMCGYSAIIVDTCAWAGPGADRHHPLFGIMRFGVPLSHNITEPEMVAFVERLFEAMTRA